MVPPVWRSEILFKTDAQGRVNALVLRQMGREQLARRIEGDADSIQEWFGHKEGKVDPAILKNYAGRYQSESGTIFTIAPGTDRLYVHQADQPQRLEMFAESEREFFSKAFDGQISFECNINGEVKAMILHAKGARDIRAPRIAAGNGPR